MENTGLRFSHAAMSCHYPVALENYYKKHFGFRRARVIPLDSNNQIVFIKNDQDFYLEIFKADASNPNTLVSTGDGPHYTAIRHLAFQVDDIDKKIQDMGADAVITLGPLDFSAFIPNWKTVWVKDPEGNIVEISQGFVDQENPPQK
jgi:glyoxylase I family protein